MNNTNNRKTVFVILAIVLGTILISSLLWSNGIFGETPEQKVYSEFIQDVEQGSVAGIILTGSYELRVRLEDSEFSHDEFIENERNSDYTCIITDRTTVAEDVREIYDKQQLEGLDGFEKIPYIALNDPSEGNFWTNVLPILSFVLIGIMVFFIIMSMRGGKGASSAMNFGKNKARLNTGVKVRFSDVAGAEEEKEELAEIVDFLKNPKKFINLGARIPKGVLLVGPPGTGKTLFAKAVAGEANVPFFSISGSDFVEMFVGVGASRVRDLFTQAKKNMPCILFIDEIDAVGRQRGAGLGGGNDEREQTLNQLLVEMDGFTTNDGIVIMAATNRVDILDPALMRPGRFDRQVYVHIPDVKGREAIFKVHARNKPIAKDIDFRNLARLTSGFSGADIANLLNEAAILAARNNRTVILMGDLLEGINKVIAGPQKKSRLITESDKRITAYHEAGHALVAKFMKFCNDVQEVSIIPRGMAAGYTLSLPKNDDNHITMNRLLDEIAMVLGGRAAEEIVIQDISTGASHDLKRVTQIARSMVCEWGMSEKLKNLFFGGDQEVFIGRDYKTQQNYSEKIAAIIDNEIQRIVQTNYERAYKALKDNLDILENMVKLLFERETIYSDEVDMLVQRKPLKEINEYIEEKLKKKKEYDNNHNPSPFSPASTIIVKEDDKKNSESKPAEQTSPQKNEQKESSSVKEPQKSEDNKETTKDNKNKDTKDDKEN
ncbi:MAG: ATP-dependent zinc metalloprotease FtsH [Bacillota bacterium]